MKRSTSIKGRARGARIRNEIFRRDWNPEFVNGVRRKMTTMVWPC
jgi:hypothetical protein